MSRSSSWFRGREIGGTRSNAAKPDAQEDRHRPFGATVMSLFGTMVDVVRTRFSLLALEIAEEKARLPLLLGLAVGALVCFALGMVVLSGWVLLLFWDTHRLAAFLVMGLVYLGLGAGLAFGLKRSLSGPSFPFEATLAELEKDAAWLRSLGKSMEPAEQPNQTASHSAKAGTHD